MWRYMLMFLLVNTYGRSFGTPVKSRVWNPNLFNDLANRCKNEFVSSQITMKAKDCNVTSPLLQDVQLRCLVFYDASTLLCDISDTTFSNLATDFTIKTSDKQNVTNFCTESADFSTPLTSNQQMMTQIFQNGVLCLNVCVDENLLSGDTNFVCKYYKWMLSVLHTLHTSVQKTSQISETSGKPSGTSTKAMSSDGKINEVTTSNVNNTSTKVKEPESDINKVVVVGNSSITSTQRNINGVPVVSGADHSTEQTAGVKNQQTNQTLKDHKKGEEKVEASVETKKHSNPEGEIDNDTDPNGESNPVGRDFVIEHPQQVNAGDDDDDDGDDPGMDTAGDDNKDDNLDGDGDAADDHPGDTDPRQNIEEKPADNHGEQQIPFNGESSQRDIFPIAMSDAFPEDDDHFFPFFLTAVIVVVVLYVLYHNKSKVGKMFFGLIVEGRQPGRRRNSRGHAYRRLDTLEQAMSANTPAPPSKIIY